MNKEERVSRVSEMLRNLSAEPDVGGFSEFPQFCEEWLYQNLHFLSEAGLKKLAKEIEGVSKTGITLRKPQGNSNL